MPGGFLLNPAQQRVNFRPTGSGHALPEPQVHVARVSDIPPAVPLEAYQTRNPSVSYATTVSEKTEGALVRRNYKAQVNGTTYTYMQTFVLPETVDELAVARATARRLRTAAKNLHEHMGHIGYPLRGLQAARAFREAYARVYDGTEVSQTATTADIGNLSQCMDHLQRINDDQVAKPADGRHYIIRAYLSPYGRDTYFYLAEDDTNGQYLTPDKSKAASWRCIIQNGTYRFVSNKGNDIFVDYVPEGAQFHNVVFDSYSNVGPERTLARGTTWGSLTVLNRSGFGAMVSTGGTFTTVRGIGNGAMTPDQRVNCNNGLIVSTDIQFLPTNEDNTLPRPQLTLATTIDNTPTLSLYGSQRCAVTLDRPFVADKWHTLCLPFTLTQQQAEEAFGEGCEMAMLTGVESEGEGLLLTFTRTTVAEAGKAYIVRVKRGAENLTFHDVHITTNTPDEGSAPSAVTFAGSFRPVSVSAGDKSVLFLSLSTQQFSTPKNAGQIGATKARFILSEQARQAKQFSMSIDGVATALTLPEVAPAPHGPTYNLNGQVVGQDYKGIVIIDGKKHIRQ